jgi:lipoprotein NlpD
MSLRFFLLFLCALSLFACSSPGGRAPVSDITLKSGSGLANNAKIRAQKKRVIEKSYTVQDGDTLYAISWKTGVDVSSLIQHNQIPKPYIINKGQVLQLVADNHSHIEKTNSKGDLSSQNVNKSSNSACTAQNCQKNQSEKVAQEKTKAYSANKVDEKTIAKKNKSIQSIKVSHWFWPVKGKLTKKFSASQSGMQGISIINKRGSSIYATAPGKVVYAGNGLRGYGNLIIIKHNNDYLSAYAHNETLLVRENESIKRGQKIAVMGDSGSDHVHLHFEIRYQGKSVDPLRYLPKK